MRPTGGSQRPGSPGFQPLDERVAARDGAIPLGLKPKDLVGVPWRVAFALQADGWWLRSDCIWAKGFSFCADRAGKVMPESARDRCTSAHEYVFHLTKSADAYYDWFAAREDGAESTKKRVALADGRKSEAEAESKAPVAEEYKRCQSARVSVDRYADSRDHLVCRPRIHGKRNWRSVWAINARPYREAHFATFSPELAEKPIIAGSPERCCPKCGMAWARIARERAGNDRPNRRQNREGDTLDAAHGEDGRAGDRRTLSAEQTGWCPPCACYDEEYRERATRVSSARKRWQQDRADRWWGRARKSAMRWDTALPPVQAAVLDPFCGSASTGVACLRHGRDFIGIEASAPYCKQARKRLEAEQFGRKPDRLGKVDVQSSLML